MKQKIGIVFNAIVVSFLTFPHSTYAWNPCGPVFEGQDATGIFHNLFDILIYVALAVGWLSLFVAILIFIFSIFRVFTLHISLGKYIKQILVGVIIFLLLIIGAQMAGISEDKKASDWFDCFGGEEKVKERAEDLKDDVAESVEGELGGLSQKSERLSSDLGDEEIKNSASSPIDTKSIKRKQHYKSGKHLNYKNSKYYNPNCIEVEGDPTALIDDKSDNLGNNKPPLYRTIEFESYEIIPFLSPSEKRIIKIVGKDLEKHSEYEIGFLATDYNGDSHDFTIERVYTDELEGKVMVPYEDVEELITNSGADRVVDIHNHPYDGDIVLPPSVSDLNFCIDLTYAARQNSIGYECWIMSPEGMYVVKSRDTNKKLEKIIYEDYLQTKGDLKKQMAPYANLFSNYEAAVIDAQCYGTSKYFHKVFDAADALRIDLSFYTYDQLLNSDALDQWDEDHMSRGRDESIKSIEDSIKDIQALLL